MVSYFFATLPVPSLHGSNKLPKLGKKRLGLVQENVLIQGVSSSPIQGEEEEN